MFYFRNRFSFKLRAFNTALNWIKVQFILTGRPLSAARAQEREQHSFSLFYKKMRVILLGELFPSQAFSTCVYK